jgi:hypothetical protein
MKLKYNHHLALYHVNLSWRNKKLKCKLIRYLQRSVRGKSEFISTKKALNNWREEMAKEYQGTAFDNEINLYTNRPSLMRTLIDHNKGGHNAHS